MSREKTYDVFISYRRQGGSEKAELTKDELLKRGFRESRMFLDTRSLSSGNYMEGILKAIDVSRNIVVVITKDSLQNVSEESPWTKEIAYALSIGKTIIPIYYDGISELRQDELPADIQSLSLENAVMYVHQYADASFDRLAERLTKAPVSIPKWGKWLIGAVTAGGLSVGLYTAVDNVADLKSNEVCVVNSSRSKSYHKTKDCPTLKNARHEIVKISEEEAIQQGKRPCKRCYKK